MSVRCYETENGSERAAVHDLRHVHRQPIKGQRQPIPTETYMHPNSGGN